MGWGGVGRGAYSVKDMASMRKRHRHGKCDVRTLTDMASVEDRHSQTWPVWRTDTHRHGKCGRQTPIDIESVEDRHRHGKCGGQTLTGIASAGKLNSQAWQF